MSSPSIALPRVARITQSRRTSAFGKIVHNEARLAWRRPIGLFGGFALPVILLVVFGEIPAFHKTSSLFDGLTAFDVYVPILLVLGLAFIALLGLPMPLVSHRQLGVLRRLSTTPVPQSWLLAAQFVVQTCIALATTLIVLLISVVGFGLAAPRSLIGLLLATLLSISGMFALGLMVAAVAKTANGASVIGRVTLFPLMFFAGLWLPREEMPSVLQTISDYTPLGAAVQAMQASMQQGFPPVAPLLVLAGYAVVFGFLAQRIFRWE
jgi:ABC-2 type transport system permease protein